MLIAPTSLGLTGPSGGQQLALAAQAIAVSPAPNPHGLELCRSPQGLQLQGDGGRGESIRVDFSSATFRYRLLRGGGRKQPLARAIGLRPGYSPLVLDATAGLGRDGFILAALGCQVILCERSAIICALLRDGLTRAGHDPQLSAIANRLQLYEGDSQTLLPQLTALHHPEVIYLDPMFPSRHQKSALVKKEMRIVRKIVGDDADTDSLLQAALAHASQRVVCKRPIQAAPLTITLPGQGAGRRPDFAITTPKHRFDIYLSHRQAQGDERCPRSPGAPNCPAPK